MRMTEKPGLGLCVEILSRMKHSENCDLLIIRLINNQIGDF